MSFQFQSSTNKHSVSDQLANCPLLFSNMIREWEAAHWTPNHLASLAGDTKFNCRLQCRFCFQKAGAIQWEGECHHVMSSVAEFLSWIESRTDDDDKNPALSFYDPKIFWCYLDYKNLDSVVEEKGVINKAIDWSCFGLVEEEPFQNYVWLGSQGAHTPCHYDTYGFNLVVQLYGSKRWILFPPEDTENLYPTRIPYEESSVYSEVNIKNPDFDKHPKFKNSQPRVLILKAGQVLYVPWKWWHFAECLETSLSINTWLQLPEDNTSRVEEAVARMIFSKWMTFNKNTDHWLNPNEDVESDEINAGYLSQTLYLLSQSPPRTLTPQTQSTKYSDAKITTPTDGSKSFSNSEVASSSHSKPNHLKNFLTCVEKILKKYPLQVTRLNSSTVVPVSSASNIELTDNPMKRPYCLLPASGTDKDFIQASASDSCIKKQRLTNLSEQTSYTDDHPIVQQLSTCPIDKLWKNVGQSEIQCETVCPFHSQGESSSEKWSQPGPLHGEFVEEELLKNLLKPDIVALLAKNLHKCYREELHEHLKKK